jgi:hypothetical protein
MAPHLGLQRIMIPSAQVSSLTTGSITLPSARGQFEDTSFQSIASYTLSSSQSTITFSSIPTTYQHLQIRYLARDTTSTVDANSLLLRFNGDSGSNYTRHYFYSDGASLNIGYVAQTNIDGGVVVGGGLAANCFGAGVIEILDAKDTSKFTTVRTISNAESNYGGNKNYVMLQSGLWRDVSAINSITVTTNGTSFAQYSQVALYGIMGA